MKLIVRESYLNKLIDVIDTPDIKIITGVRRSGKSKLLDCFHDYLKSENKGNVIRIKLNLKEYEKLLDKEKLYEYADKNYIAGVSNYLLIDEIQLCKGFERIINSLYEEERFDIYLTGSNAFLLSSDLATLFGGRVFEINMFPFSFKEFLKYFEYKDIYDAFDEYVIKGGMSGSYLYKNQSDAFKYIEGIYKTTIIKDIIKKYNIDNEDLLILIANYLIDNLGNITSVRNLANCLTSNTYKTNDKTAGSYLEYLCKSFLFYSLKRYDIKGKKYLKSEKKYCLVDTSFRYATIGTKNADYRHLYENIVAIELLRRGYELYVGVLKNKKIDYVAIKNGNKLYVQVSDDISKEETFKREVEPLLSIKDAYPKLLIARIKHPESQYEGVKIIDIADWLKSS